MTNRIQVHASGHKFKPPIEGVFNAGEVPDLEGYRFVWTSNLDTPDVPKVEIETDKPE